MLGIIPNLTMITQEKIEDIIKDNPGNLANLYDNDNPKQFYILYRAENLDEMKSVLEKTAAYAPFTKLQEGVLATGKHEYAQIISKTISQNRGYAHLLYGQSISTNVQ